MHPRNRRRALVAIALGMGMACCVAWVAAAPPAKPGGASGLGLHFFTRKSSSEASNKPPTESGRVPIRTDVRKSANIDVAKRSTATDEAAATTASKNPGKPETNTRVPSLDKSSTRRNSVPSGEVVELPESPDNPRSATVRVNSHADTASEADEVVPRIPDDDETALAPLTTTERPATSKPSRVRPRSETSTEAARREQSPAQVQRKPIEADPEESISTSTIRSQTDVSAGLSISWKIDGDLTLGESRKALLVIQNSGGHDVTDVVARAVFSDALEVVRTIPERERLKQFSIWKMERIPAGTTQKIELLVRATQSGDAACVASVVGTQTVSRSLQILRPELEVSVAIPESATAGDAVAAVVEISNAGRGAIRDVKAAIDLSEGLLHARGRLFEIDAGTLAQGESRKLRIPLTAVFSGEQQLTATATGTGAEQRVAIATIEVSGPKLSLSVRGPAMRYVDRKARYALSARNEGTAETSNLKLRLQPPAGFDFASATDGGTWDPDQRVVEWFVAELRGGAVVEVSADLIARQPGAYSLDARLVTDQGGQVDAQTETVVDSTPKLVVEVVELDDPVEVGTETAWEIRLRNDGSRPSTKNRVFAELPAGVRLVDAQGPTKSATDKELVAYAALAELKPGAHAVYTIRVIGTQPGNQRIKVRVTSAEAEPIAIEETTRFYSDR